MAKLARAPLLEAMTLDELIVADLLGVLVDYAEVASLLGRSTEQIRTVVKSAARKIESDLPAQACVVAWARGADLNVLRGDALRFTLQNRQAAQQLVARAKAAAGAGVATGAATGAHEPNPTDSHP